MMFNGQRAWLAVVRNRQYVSSVTPSVPKEPWVCSRSKPTPRVVVRWTWKARSAPTEKYVTITVRTGLSSEPTSRNSRSSAPSGNSPGIFILLPDQETRSIRTTVSVPDGGTVLLGGMKQVGEVEVEAGVPILSKIPILKRAFSNTTVVKDTPNSVDPAQGQDFDPEGSRGRSFPDAAKFSAVQLGNSRRARHA